MQDEKEVETTADHRTILVESAHQGFQCQQYLDDKQFVTSEEPVESDELLTVKLGRLQMALDFQSLLLEKCHLLVLVEHWDQRYCRSC